MSAELRFQLLGPVQVSYAGQPLPVGGAKPKAVLAALLCHPNTPVDTDRLIRWVWGEGKEVARDNLYHYITDLRTALAPADDQVRLEGLRPNYRLTVPEQVIDWHRFTALLDQARSSRQAGEPAAAMAFLDQALDLWRGPALDGLGDALAELRATMTTRRLSAAEDLAELELDHGEPAHVPDLLGQLCQQHHGRERAAALLIRALGALGRRDDAVAVYHRTRQHTRHTLGLDPHGPLEHAYQMILHGPTATTATAAAGQAARAGLPRLAGHFTGRHPELDQLSTLLTGPNDQPQVVVICAVDGMAGIGKTELAKHAAYQHAEHFPDGIVFLDLLGYTPDARPLDPAAALDRLLRRLGVAGTQIPPDLEDRATLYRSKLADKQMLIVLDNARTSTQVLPLLPAAPGCRVVITSRRRLTALDDAHPVHLDILHPADAHTLFTRITGLDPAPEESTTIGQIVTACGRLPLAIRITAARYRNHAWTSLAELQAHLADQHERLATMDDGERSITAAFTVSYRSLPGDQRRMFRLLGLIPGPEPDTDAYAAAALADTTLSEAQRLLTHLAEASLLTRTTPGRYAFHDLLRAYATQRGLDEEPEAERQAALTRLLDHYTHTASRAAERAYPQDRGHLPQPPAPPTPRPDFTGRAEAVAWLDTERLNLLAAAAHAATHGWPVHTSHLSRALARHLRTRGHYTNALTLHTHALHATRATGDRAGEGHALASLGEVYRLVDRYERAIDHLRQALVIAREVGDPGSEGRALGGLGEIYRQVGRYDQAIDHYQQALTIAHETGDRTGERRALGGIGGVYRMVGRYQQAIDHFQRALATARQAGDRTGESYTLASLGETYRMVGRYDQAINHFRRALAIAHEAGDRTGESDVLTFLGEVYRVVGRYQQAIDHHQQALAIAQEVGDRASESYALTFLGVVYRLVGRYQQAIDHHQQALAIARDIGDRNGEFEAHNGLGEALRATGQPDQALTRHQDAAALAVELGQPHDHARALAGIAHAHHDLGDPGQARRHWQQALDIFTQLGTPEADQIRAHLATLDQPDGRAV